METAPTLILYTVTGKSRPGEHCWDDPSVPPYFFDDRDIAKQALLELRTHLLAGRDPDDSPLCLERIETVPMTAAAIMVLLNDGFAAIINGLHGYRNDRGGPAAPYTQAPDAPR